MPSVSLSTWSSSSLNLAIWSAIVKRRYAGMICTVIRAPTGIPNCLVRDCCSAAKISSCGKKQLVLLRIRDGLFYPGYRIHQQKRGKEEKISCFTFFNFFAIYFTNWKLFYFWIGTEQILSGIWDPEKIYLGSCTRIQRSKKHRIRIRNTGSKGNYFTRGIVFYQQ